MNTVVECSINNNYTACEGWVFQFFAAPWGVQFTVVFSVLDMEYACLRIFWVGTQVVSDIVFVNHIMSYPYPLKFPKHFCHI